jgi:hypothetical protein
MTLPLSVCTALKQKNCGTPYGIKVEVECFPDDHLLPARTLPHAAVAFVQDTILSKKKFGKCTSQA